MIDPELTMTFPPLGQTVRRLAAVPDRPRGLGLGESL